MALAGLDSIRALHQIEAQNTRITENYLAGHHFLEEIRSSLYLSTTLVRDYLLEPDSEAARASLASLHELRREMDTAVGAYSASIRPGERGLFSELRQEVNSYWSALAPAMQWGPQERRAQGYRFLQTRVIPRRTLTLGIADKIDAVNERALSVGNRRSSQLLVDYRRRVATILGLTLGIGLLLASASILHILRLEKESQTRYGLLQRAQDELKRLSASLVEAQERERRTISRELHDEVGQSLNALLVDLGNLAAVTAPENEEAQRLLNTAKRLADESVKSVRNMSLLLRPSMLDDFGLVPALHWQAREVSRRTGMRIDVDAEDVPDELPDEYKTCVYRVVQEALQNSSRHAGAHSVRILVRQHPDRVALTVRDDGRGFDAERVRGLGLLGMEERAKHLGGTFEIESRPGRGTELRIELPLARRAARAIEVA
jgi:signal transduction histidine kinase